MGELRWVKCGTAWCDFATVSLATAPNIGVYIIWGSSAGRAAVVYVGSGNVADRISAHRRDERITSQGNLRVTWAETTEAVRYGIEQYLHDHYQPVVGEAPGVQAIAANLPQ